MRFLRRTPTSGRRLPVSRRTVSPPPAERVVCQHLQPLLEGLVREHGLRVVERAEGFGSGLAFLLDGELPIEELAAAPREPFVHVIASRRLVFCERCWQSLGEWKLHRDQWT